MRKIILFLMLIGIAGALEVSINDQDPTPAEAGKPVNVWLKIDNPDPDNTEREIFVEILPKDNLEISPGEDVEKRVGVLLPGSSQIVQFRLFVQDEAYEGTHMLEAQVTSEDTSFSKDLGITVTDKDFKDVDLSIGDIESDPSRIKPGDDNVKLTVTILNLGDGRAQGLKAQLVGLPDGIEFSESYSGSELLGNVEADGTADATFYIDVDESVEPKEHLAGLKVEYKYKPDEEENDFVFEQKTLPLRISVKPVPLYEITATALTPEELTAGDDEVKLKITITNVGHETGDSVKLKAYGKTEQPFSFEQSSDFIAPSLEPGESGDATLVFDVDDDANLQTYYLDLEIKNIVNEDVITYDKKVTVAVTYPKPDNPWRFVIPGVIVLAIAAVVIIVNMFRKRGGSKKAKGRYGKSFID